VRFLAASVAALAGLAVVGAAKAVDATLPGVSNPRQAHLDYMLKCQGCHRPDGLGDARSTPPLSSSVGRFLGAPGGREFLARVPGVASVDLDDARLAEVLNWTLYRFDRANVPPGFTPYTAAEVGRLRKAPLRTERAAARAALLDKLRPAPADTKR
jgi:hypothetical protein